MSIYIHEIETRLINSKKNGWKKGSQNKSLKEKIKNIYKNKKFSKTLILRFIIYVYLILHIINQVDFTHNKTLILRLINPDTGFLEPATLNITTRDHVDCGKFKTDGVKWVW